MSWREFEMLVTECVRLQGYRVAETEGDGVYGGVDLVLTKLGKSGGETFLVHCKQWHVYKVGVDVVRKLHGAIAVRRMPRGAQRLEKGWALLDGLLLERLVRPVDHILAITAKSVCLPLAIDAIRQTLFVFDGATSTPTRGPPAGHQGVSGGLQQVGFDMTLADLTSTSRRGRRAGVVVRRIPAGCGGPAATPSTCDCSTPAASDAAPQSPRPDLRCHLQGTSTAPRRLLRLA